VSSIINWAKTELKKIKFPLFTCEAVIVECCFLLKDAYGAIEKIFAFLKTGKIKIPFHLNSEMMAVESLINRYSNPK
jgi:hypothetical protein